MFALVVGFDLALSPPDVEAGVLPALEPFDGLGADLFPPEHHLEEPLAEDLLEAGEVEVLHGEVDAVLAKETERNRSMRMGVGATPGKIP